MNTKALSVHPHFMAFEYCPSGVETSEALSLIALGLAERVVSTMRNNLVRNGETRTCHPRRISSLREIMGESAITTFTCKMPGVLIEPPPPTFFYYTSGGQPFRSSRSFMANSGAMAVYTTLDPTSLTRQIEGQPKSWLSGPESVTRKQLEGIIAHLSELKEPVPQTARDYADSLQRVCGAIFDTVTGGELPHISCQVGYTSHKDFLQP